MARGHRARKRLIRQNKLRLRAMRNATIARRKGQQLKAELCSFQRRLEDDVNNSKKTTTTNSTAQEQKTSTPGDLVPIVFCRRDTSGPQSGEVGGVWMQPTKLKQGSYNFQGIFIYPISQGEIDSNFTAHLTYVGDQNLKARGGTTPTLNKYYRSVATMDSAPNVCPITSGKIFCHPDAVSFISHVAKPTGYTLPFSDRHKFYYNEFELTIGGTADTSNTTFFYSGPNKHKIIEVKTGTDRNSALLASGYSFGLSHNNTLVSGSTFTGRAVGTIFNFFGDSVGDLRNPISPNYTVLGASAEDQPVNWVFIGDATFNPRTDLSQGITSTAIGGIVHELHLSPVADPTSFDSSYDFTDYADITYLEIQGDIYDESNHLEGEYKTTTRQITMLVEKGVRVPLYSAGTPNTNESSQHFVDLAMHLFALNKRLIAGTTADIASPIDTSNLQALASFHTNQGLFFNGIIEQSVNIIDFISTMSPFYFLYFVSENGRYAFKPMLPLTSGNQIDTTALTPAATFTDSNIIFGTFSKEYVEGEERRDVQIAVVYRESRKDRIGFQKSARVRYANVANDARVVQYDMTDCCVTDSHAQNFAKLQLATRRHSTHSISFDTPLLTTSLSVGDLIKVQRVRLNSVGDNRTETNHYQVTSITHATDGITTIGAMLFPLHSSLNIALISNDVVNASFTIT